MIIKPKMSSGCEMDAVFKYLGPWYRSQIRFVLTGLKVSMYNFNSFSSETDFAFV